MTRFLSSKKYGHERGLSAAFRQWRAVSHCRFMHGYSLEFEFVFGVLALFFVGLYLYLGPWTCCRI